MRTNISNSTLFKTLSSLFLFLILQISLFAQKNLYYTTDFINADQSWYTGVTAEHSFEIKNGAYICSNKSITGSSWFAGTSTYINPDKDYRYEFILKETASYGDNLGGIYLNIDKNKRLEFTLNPERFEYSICSNDNGKYTYLYEYYGSNTNKRSSAMKPRGTANKLVIEHIDALVRFKLNDVELLSIPFKDSGFDNINGTMGIIMKTNMTLELESVSLYHDVILKTIENLPKGIKRENLGPNINTIYSEKLPHISPDGKTLFYSIQGNPLNTGGIEDGDEIYFSTLNADNTWKKSINIGKPLNNINPNGVISVTPDNNTMLLMHQYNADGTYKNAGISLTNKTETGWSVPKDVIIKNYYNTAETNEFSLTADQKTLFMCIQREDTKGEKDVYVSFIQADGSFSEPMNLGNQINTKKGELTPFIAADGVTLYFASYGHPTYGSADIFMSRRLDSTYTNWSEPLNLGPEINSTFWDAYYTVTASGNYAYLVTGEHSIGEIDIIRVALPASAKPNPVVLIQGKVVHASTKQALKADIQYIDLKTGKEVGTATSDPKTGAYKIVLPAGSYYGFLAQKNDFFSVSDNIDLSSLVEYQEIERDLYLAPLITGQTIRLNNLFFDFGKSDLRKESLAELNRTVELMKKYPSMTIEISGHTDNVGGDTDNVTLSLNRAQSVVMYIISKGIDTTRLKSNGYGKSKPISTNDTEEGRQLNRRVDFTIIKM